MSVRILGVAAAIFVSSMAQAASDELCHRLRTFENAQVSGSERRWVEFHWGFDKASIWSWGCRHSEDQMAKETCDWLMKNTNQEFSMLLPHSIMGCHGYRFPKFAYYDWDSIVSTIRLRGAADRDILIDLNYGGLPGGEEALRLSVGNVSEGRKPKELPPIKPMPADSQTPTS